jgi:hypothetical protein
MQHRITIAAASPDGSYAVHGAATLKSRTPCLCAARQLIAAGADPHSLLVAQSPDVTICPATLGSITRPRQKMTNFDVKRVLQAGGQF